MVPGAESLLNKAYSWEKKQNIRTNFLKKKTATWITIVAAAFTIINTILRQR